MSIAIAYIPTGYTAQQKKVMIEGTKKGCMEGMNLPPEFAYVMVHEIPPENMDERTYGMKCLFIYTTYGKRPQGKHVIAKAFDDACAAAFGDEKGQTYVIFKEHHDENVGDNGNLRPFSPGYANFNPGKALEEKK